MPCRATACACAWTRATWSRSTTEPLRTAARSATMAGPAQTAFADVPHAVRVARQRRRRAPRPADVSARHGRDARLHAGRHLRLGERTSVVYGETVSVRVDIGARPVIKKKK